MSLSLSAPHAGHSFDLDAAQDKKTRRKQLLAVRQAIPEDLKKQYDHVLCLQIQSWLQEKAVKSVSVFLPIRNEPNLKELYEMLSGNIQMALPYVSTKDSPLEFIAWRPGDELVEGAFRIPVPKAMQRIPIPDVLIIPCVGYTAGHYRLGYGGGFFDRTLEGQDNVLTLGVAYSCLKTDFPVEQFDMPLNAIITEVGLE
jgi:5,10-methenyltetrahydrofolate synthetase